MDAAVRYHYLIDSLIDRALLAYASYLEPEYITNYGVVKRKPRASQPASYNTYKLLADVLLDSRSFRSSGEIDTLIIRLGLARGVLTRDGTGPVKSALTLGCTSRHYVSESGAESKGVKIGPILDEIRGIDLRSFLPAPDSEVNL